MHIYYVCDEVNGDRKKERLSVSPPARKLPSERIKAKAKELKKVVYTPNPDGKDEGEAEFV